VSGLKTVALGDPPRHQLTTRNLKLETRNPKLESDSCRLRPATGDLTCYNLASPASVSEAIV